MTMHPAGDGIRMEQRFDRKMLSPAGRTADASLTIRGAGFSLMGRGRTVNQDAFYIDPDRRYFVVADGLGGHRAGEEASRLAIASLREHADKFMRLGSDVALLAGLRLAFDETNQRILDAATQTSVLSGMGTTAVMATLARNRLQLAAVGDSRAYLIREGVVRQLTVDQTVAQVLLDAGMFAGMDPRNVPNHNVLWNCLGCAEFCEVEPFVVSLQPYDRLILVSDGVSDCVETATLPQVVARCREPSDIAEELVIMAQQNGGCDDATCVVICCDPPRDSRTTRPRQRVAR